MSQLPESERNKAIQGIVTKTRKLKPLHPRKKQKQGGDNQPNNQQIESRTQRNDQLMLQSTSPPKTPSYAEMARAQFKAKAANSPNAVSSVIDVESDSEEVVYPPPILTHKRPHQRAKRSARVRFATNENVTDFKEDVQRVTRRDAKHDREGFSTHLGKRPNRVNNPRTNRQPKPLGALVIYNNMEPDDLEAAIKQKDPPAHRLIKSYVQCSGHYILCANPGDISELKDRLHAHSNHTFKVKAYIPREDRLANKGKSGLKKLAKATKFCPAAIAGEKCKGCSLTGCPKRN